MKGKKGNQKPLLKTFMTLNTHYINNILLSYASHHSVHQTGLSGGPVCLSLLLLGLLVLTFTNKLKVTCVKTENLHLTIL